MRSVERKDELGEVFTPPSLIKDIISNMKPESFEPDKTFLDPTCGNGNILVGVAIHKISLIQNHITAELLFIIANSLYGVDIMEDNVVDSRTRLFHLFRDIHNQLNLEFDGVRYATAFQHHIILCDFFKCDWEFDQ
jgi:type I restriction-modification system DNA methylase subunit